MEIQIKQTPENKRFILTNSGYKTIYEAKKDIGGNAAQIYDYLFSEYSRITSAARKGEIKKKVKLSFAKKMEEIKQKQAEKVKKPRKPKVDVKKVVEKVEEKSISGVHDAFRKFVGKTVIYMFVSGGTIIRQMVLEIPSNFSSWWHKNSFDIIMFDSGTSLFDVHPDGNIFIYEEVLDISPKKVIQAFREGITHCMFEPIKVWAQNTLEDAKSESTKKKYRAILNKIAKYIIMYDAGVPEDKIPDICNDLQIDINIDLPFSEHHFIECKSIKKNLRTFNFINTRINHINEITSLEYEEVSLEQLLQINKELDDTNSFYTCNMGNENVCSISTLTKQYSLTNKYMETVKEFEKSTGLNEISIDDIADKELSDFVQPHYNATIDFQDHYEAIGINHIDMKKAYANFKTCKFYKGFLGKITDFRKTDHIVSIGIYKICELYIPEGRFKEYNTKMKIYLNNNIYTSAELEMLSSYGCTYKILCGCWGSIIDFEFNEEMLTEKDNGVSYYAKWCGAIDSHNLSKKFWIKGNYDYYQVMLNEYGADKVKFFKNGKICISYPKKYNYHKAHITNFITAYQRINVIEQLMQIDQVNIVRVCVDGIYHTQENVTLCNVFRPKTDFNFGNVSGEYFISNLGSEISTHVDFREHYMKTLNIGPGGNGKTHSNLTDKGFVKVLYLAPSWKLARNKSKEYDVSVNVWANAITKDPSKINLIKRFNVLVFDEVSMMNEVDKQYILETYSNMKIIFCGDLGYQLSCISGTEMNSSGFDKIIENTTNYRCKDIKLFNLLDTLRSMIKKGVNKFEINKYVLSKFVKQTVENYSVCDMILSGTNEIKDKYTAMMAGKFSEEKYYITKSNRVYSNGEIIIGDKPEDCVSEIRHCFTVHSIQGETAPNKLYIDSSKMFCSRMFYTALSRAKTMEQIIII